jgi:very-short-patch-repair endonuclease
MVCSTQQSSNARAWALAESQHGVVSTRQLSELGLSRRAIQHRVARGRLHRVMRGVYAVGRPELSRRGRWMAAVLCCEPEVVLSHHSAAALWEIGDERLGRVEVSSQTASYIRRPGIRVHRRSSLLPCDLDVRDGIPVTVPARTLIDLASQLGSGPIERAINEADRLDLIDPEALRASLRRYRGQPGVARMRVVLDRRTFRMTDSELERRFLPLVDAVGLSRPLTRQHVNGFRVDFYWPDLGLVVETDGLRYHRTPARQARDRLRDQTHTAAGLTPLRFTHAQVRFESAHVRGILAAVARRLSGGGGNGRSG